MFNKEKTIAIIEKCFPWFLLSQVIIDVLTTLFVHVISFPISMGMIIRFSFIFIAAIYIMLKGNKFNKILLFMLIAINLYQLIYLYIKIPELNLFANIRYYLRSSYYPIMILFLDIYKNKIEQNKFFNIINTNLILIFIIYVLSIITKSSLLMYEGGMYGISAWFSSGNEISTIMTILSLISLYSFLNKKNTINLLVILASIFVLIMIGTKNSLVALLLLLLLTTITLLIETIKDKKNIKYLLIHILVLIIVFINYKDFPAYKNIMYVKNTQKIETIKKSYTEHTEIPEELIDFRTNNYQVNDRNEFLASISLNVTKNEINKQKLQISGYFYPKYFDLSHPKYIEKYLILYNDINRYKFKLQDTYNKYVQELIDENYNTDFSGLSASLDIDEISTDKPFNIEIMIKIDGVEKNYNVINNIKTDQKTVIKRDGMLELYPNSAKKTEKKICEPKIKIPLLSGRVERVNNFVSCNPNYKTFQFIFGSGYIKNFTGSNGFEMDIIEIFITYGLIGFIVYFAMTFKMLIEIFILMLKKPKIAYKNYNYILIISLLIGMCLAAIVGHTILTPASAIYLALILILIYIKFKEYNNEK